MTIPSLFTQCKNNLAHVQESIIKDTQLEQTILNKSRDLRARFKPSLTIHERMDDTIQSIGWQADS